LIIRQTTKIRPPRRRSRIAAWLSILALALPMLVPVAQGIPLSGAMDETQAPLYLVLCKTMQDGTSGPSPDPKQDRNVSDCPVCLGLSFAKSVLMPTFGALAVCDSQLRTLAFNRANETGNGRPVRRSYARAPPVSV